MSIRDGIGIAILGTCAACAAWAGVALVPGIASAAEKGAREATRQERIAHARELMGKHYGRSAVRSGEEVARMRELVHAWTREALPSRFSKQAKPIARSILRESDRYGFDPVFLVSVIQAESSFNPATLGSAGEVGLMQIKPSTAQWICKRARIPYKGKRWLKGPEANIQVGAAFLAYLRDRYDSHARLYLSAYNMGQTNLKELRDRNIWPKEYAWRVMEKYVSYYRQLKAKLVAQKSRAKPQLARGLTSAEKDGASSKAKRDPGARKNSR